MNRLPGLRALSVLLCLIAALTACGTTPSAAPGSPVPDGRLTVAVEFGPKAGLAIDTDDAFVLSTLGVDETLVRADPSGQSNLDRYCSPTFGTLLGSLTQTPDPAQRQQIFRAEAKQLIQDVVGVPLVHPQARVGMRNVTGSTPDPQEHYLLTPQLARTG